MRIRLRIPRADLSHTTVYMFINGGLVTGNCGLTIRNGELAAFLLRLDPDEVEVDRENIPDDVFHRLAGFKAVIWV